ncbi:cytochrome P450 [Xylariales sp. PMI_506]|nr:cytochrome P450 [Xylariales sp. PMI_506]
MDFPLPTLGFVQNGKQLHIAAAIIGVSSHLLYWIRGYHDVRATTILRAHLALYAALAAASVTATHSSITVGIVQATSLSLTYLVALFLSMTTYRLFFHRLSRFPGPLAAKVTKFYGPWLSRNAQLYEEHFDLVKKYGDFVRTGPNELLLFRIDAITKIHGPQTKCDKSKSMYEFFNFKGTENIDSIKTREKHRPRRQLWDKALNNKALSKYEIHTRAVIKTWLDKLEAKSSGPKPPQPVNLPHFAELVALDAIGRVGYSRDFGTVAAERANRILDLADVTFASVASLGHLDWPLAISGDLGLSAELSEFENLTVEIADEHERDATETTDDILTYFEQDYKSKDPKAFFNREILYADSQIIMIGGVPTMASSMSFVFYYLTKHPAVTQRLREELAPIFGHASPGEFADADLAGIEYLNAVLEESMRLVTPGGSNAPRTTPPEGIMVDDVFIPGNVKVFAPTWAFSRSDRYFMQALEFIPERWTTRPDLIIDRRAHFPFLVGPWNCPGKRYAMMVLRQFVAYTVWHYEFDFAPGEDGTDIHAKAKFQLQVKAGPMYLTFKKRNV